MALLTSSQESPGRLEGYLSPAAAWAFSIGTAIGWGSFVITSNNYLLKAGPLGSTLGMLAGMLIMVLIARNYHYLMNRYPDVGGAYAYTKNVFGYDYGFLTGWFIVMTYFAVLWANATSVPLFAHYFVGDVFRFGFHYTLFDYNIYLGEALLSIGAVIVFGFLCLGFKRFSAKLMVGLAVVFSAGITICFAEAVGTLDPSMATFDPAFLPDHNTVYQVIAIACISPWAFIGFENISHMTEEFKFSRTSSFKVLVTVVVTVSALYIFIILLSVTAYPPQFDSWIDYVSNLDSIGGIEGLPAFYAASHYFGDWGIRILSFALFSLIATSLIGNMTALSRLIYALAKDKVLPSGLADLNDKGVPAKSLLLIIGVSCIIPFLGRTAIGWIVDVTTIGATITYGFVSAATYSTARSQKDFGYTVCGMAGLVIMIVMGMVLILPNLFAEATMATESYFLFTVWSLLGLLFFRYILHHDPDNRFGESVIVWIVLLAFVLFMSCVWMEQSAEDAADAAMADLQAHYEQSFAAGRPIDSSSFFESEHNVIHIVNTRNTFIILCIFALSLGVMISNYSLMRKRENENILQLGVERIRANTDSLTSVGNKHAFDERERKLDQTIAQSPSTEFAIIICDLNDLKTVNDTMGHQEGDDYIKTACSLICRTFKHSPVFRVGGDEFCVIADGGDFANRHELLAEIDNWSVENLTEGNIMVIAVGMADYDSSIDENTASVYERADARMYERKRELKAMRAKST